MKTCRIPGCSGFSSRWGDLCSTHKARERRHGHSLQEGVTKADLGPYLRQLKARKLRNLDNPLWKLLEARWCALVDHCRTTLAAHQAVPMNRHERQACHEIVDLEPHVLAETVVGTALALFLMQEQAPRRFKSDDAFRHQLARRVRALADVNIGSFYDHATGKTKRVYRDLPGRTTVIIGALLERTFGQAGLMLAKKEREDAERRFSEVEQITDAVKALV